MRYLVLVLMLVSWLSISRSTAQTPEVQIRLAHVADAFSRVNVRVDGELTLRNIDLGDFSDWAAIPTGSHEIIITNGQGQALLDPITFNLIDNPGFTLVLTNTQVLIFNEITAPVPFNQVRVTFFNAADVEPERLPRLQADGEIWVENTAFNSPAYFREFPFGQFQRLFAAYGETLLGEFTPATPHMSYTLITAEVDGELTLISDVADNNTRLRVAQFAADVVIVDVLLGENRVVPNVQYEGFTEVVNVPAGTYALAIVPAAQGIETALLPPQEITLDPTNNGGFYTLVLEGSAENLSSEIRTYDPSAIADNESLVAGENALVEIRHTIQDAPPIDLLLSDGTMLIQGLAYGKDVGVLDLPAGVYNLRITVSGQPDEVLYERGGTTLDGGKIYWMSLIGRYENVTAGRQRLSFVSFCVAEGGCP